MMKLPPDLYYTAEHLWTQEADDGIWLAGITDYAQDLLGDIVFIEFPSVGDTLVAGRPCGLVESVKTGSDLHAPVDGVVTAVNEVLSNQPESINDHPYVSWIFKFRPADATQDIHLLTAQAYAELID